MAELSNYDNAAAKVASADEQEKVLLSWLRIKHGEGMTLLKKERAWDQMPQAMLYLEGKQYSMKSRTISRIVDNRMRKIAMEACATLTDVRPIWNYETYAEEFKKQGDVLNKLARAWWKNTKADKRLVSILLYALCGGTGYGLLTFNKELQGGQGDLELIPFDPRDVVPIDPVYSDSIQDWRGVILRQRMPLETVKRMFPSKAPKIFGKELTWAPIPRTDSSSGMGSIVSPQWEVLEGKKNVQDPPGVDVMRAYMKDDTLNLGDKPITLGEGEWSYTVYPMGWTREDGTVVTKEEAKLYPRGRLIIFTPEAVLKDLPNPHWHGLFPVVRFTMDPIPWTLLGASVLGDLIPLQDALNEALRGAEDGLNQWVRRSVAADKRAMPKSALDALDTRKAGVKFHYNPAAGEPFKVLDGPDPQVFTIYNNLIEYLKVAMDDASGMRGVQQLSQLGQMPSADTMERFMEALSPILRLRSRNMEISLSELAEMLKVGFFQWYSAPRRIELLGKDGLTREDFDFDPGTLVPAGEGTRQERAMEHHKLFSFQVAPNSWLNVSHTTQKMFMLQLLRSNLMDPWTVWTQFDVPDIGPYPAETVPERIVKAREQGLMQGPTPELVQAQLQSQLQQLQMQQIQMQQMMMQMMAQQQMGGGMPPGGTPPQMGPAPAGGPPAPPGPNASGGRPPSGAVAPHFETRDGGTRPVVSESA